MRKRLFIDLLLLERNQSYGFQEYIFNILNYFHKNRQTLSYDEVIIICNNSVSDMFDNFSDTFSLRTYNCDSYLRRFWYQTFFPFIIKFNKNDVLFAPGNYSGLFKKCKEVLVIHDLLFKRKEWLPNRLMRLQRSFYIPNSIRKADKVVAISNYTKEDIEQYYPQSIGKIEVIYNSFDFAKYSKTKDPHIVGNYFLAICSNAYHKNLKTVLLAFGKYCDKGGEMDLVFVGNIKRTSEVAIIMESFPEHIKNRIIIKSQISNEELGGLYKNASCYISASLFEGLGMPVVEAMYFGLPVLLSNIKPHREVSLEKGEYFDPNSIDDLASKMQTVKLGKKDYSKEIEFIFSDVNTSARYVELLNRVSNI